MYTLHPVTTETVSEFLRAVDSDSGNVSVERARQGIAWMRAGDSRGPDVVSHSLATFLTGRAPVFAMADVSFSGWEASIDRGVGMLLRPPSRLFVDAGMDRSVAQAFPIRLDPQRGMMAGSYVPPHLIGDLHDLLEQRMDRQLRRLQEAELEPVITLGAMLRAIAYAREHKTGLLEAMDVLHPQIDAIQIVQITRRKDIDPQLLKRLDEAIKPPKQPGLIARLFGRSISADVDHVQDGRPTKPN